MDILRDVLSKYAEQGDDGLGGAIAEIVGHGYLLEHLDALARGERLPAADPPAGYRHPNGFTKIRLVVLPDCGWALRLHVWNPRAADRDVHSHRWNFASRVLTGSLAESSYELTEGTRRWMYDCAPSADGRYVLRRPRECDVRLVREDIYEPGNSYQRSAETLHMAWAAGTSPAISLFLQGPQRHTATTVIRPRRAARSQAAAVPRYTGSELLSLLREVAGQIKDG